MFTESTGTNNMDGMLRESTVEIINRDECRDSIENSVRSRISSESHTLLCTQDKQEHTIHPSRTCQVRDD